MARKLFTPEEFKNIYSKVPRLCIDPVVRTDGGILLALRGAGHGYENKWHLPGGTMFYNETVEEALSRILKDEVNVEAKMIKLLGHLEFPSEQKERGFGRTISLCILCDLISGTPTPDEDASEVKMFSEIPENTLEEQKAFLQKHWAEIY